VGRKKARFRGLPAGKKTPVRRVASVGFLIFARLFESLVNDVFQQRVCKLSRHLTKLH